MIEGRYVANNWAVTRLANACVILEIAPAREAGRDSRWAHSGAVTQLEVHSSVRDLDGIDLGDIELIELTPGERCAAIR